MTDEEKLKMYVELEPDLVVFDQTKNELEIKRLVEKTESIEELRAEVRELRDYQARQDKKIIQEMKNGGVIIEKTVKPT